MVPVQDPVSLGAVDVARFTGDMVLVELTETAVEVHGNTELPARKLILRLALIFRYRGHPGRERTEIELAVGFIEPHQLHHAIAAPVS